MKFSHKVSFRKAIIVSLTGVFVATGCKTYKTTTDNFDGGILASVDRGRMIVQGSCAGCHADPQTHHLSGKQFPTPGIFGKVYAANLTQSKSHGVLTKYTLADLAYLMRTGITKDGKFMTYMLRPNMSNEDVAAMWAYLHSDDVHVLPVDLVPGTTNLNFLGHMGAIFLGSPLPYRPDVPHVNENDAVAYGRYLVDNIGCYHCHSKKGMMSLNHERPEQTKGYMAGGRMFKMPDGKIRGSNITMDKETGIGNYSKEEFRNAVLRAMDEENKKLRPPMKAFHHMTDKESDAIYAYIQTLAPVKHAVN
jgi:hypothetical protein